MARWIEKPSQRKKTRYYHQFTYLYCPFALLAPLGAKSARGFSFDSDQDGNIPEKDKKSFKECLADEELKYKGVQKETWYVYSLGTCLMYLWSSPETL